MTGFLFPCYILHQSGVIKTLHGICGRIKLLQWNSELTETNEKAQIKTLQSEPHLLLLHFLNSFSKISWKTHAFQLPKCFQNPLKVCGILQKARKPLLYFTCKKGICCLADQWGRVSQCRGWDAWYLCDVYWWSTDVFPHHPTGTWHCWPSAFQPAPLCSPEQKQSMEQTGAKLLRGFVAYGQMCFASRPPNSFSLVTWTEFEPRRPEGKKECINPLSPCYI